MGVAIPRHGGALLVRGGGGVLVPGPVLAAGLLSADLAAGAPRGHIKRFLGVLPRLGVDIVRGAGQLPTCTKDHQVDCHEVIVFCTY